MSDGNIDPETETERTYDPNCPVFTGLKANPLTPAVLTQAKYKFTPATIDKVAYFNSVGVSFNDGTSKTFALKPPA